MNINKMLEKKQKERQSNPDKSIPISPEIKMLDSVQSIPIDSIHENKDQPRQRYDEKKIEALAKSIKERELIQPITVKPYGKDYMIIAGHRRYRAFKFLKEKNIPCIVQNKARNNDELTELALIENLQRDDLDAYEITISIKKLEEKGRTVADICNLTGYQKSQVYNYKKAYDQIEKGEITKESLIEKGIYKVIFPMIGKSRKKNSKRVKKEWFNVVKKQADKAIKSSSKDDLKKAKIAFTEILNSIDIALGGDVI